jgi:2'-5' RNA ligase
MMVDTLAQLWEDRHELEPRLTDDAFCRETAEGREEYATLLIEIDNESIGRSLTEAMDALNGIEGVSTPPSEYLHITVKTIGFVVEEPTNEYEVSPGDIREISTAVESLFEDIDPFVVELPRLNLFPSVVLCEVREQGELAELHQRVLSVPNVIEHQYDGDSYTPHASIAHFRTESGFRSARSWVEQNREIETQSVTVDAIRLIEMDPRTLYPNFETVQQFDLGE